MKLYKLTDENSEAFNNTRLDVGVTISLSLKENPKLCSADLLHSNRYKDSVLALNYIHRNFKNPQLWEVSGDIIQESWDQVGSFMLTPIKKLEIPKWYATEESRHKVYANFMSSVAEVARDDFTGTLKFEDALSAINDYFETCDENKRPLANLKFRDLLHETYELFMSKTKLAEFGFILYLDAFCRLDPSYLPIHIASMYESACTVGLPAHIILENSTGEL